MKINRSEINTCMNSKGIQWIRMTKTLKKQYRNQIEILEMKTQ
jgi:hypothetical protein